MVKSNLNSQIEYAETKHLDEEDKKHQTSFYLIDLKATHSERRKNYIIGLGSLHKQYSKNFGISYFPIYLISAKKRVKAKIGVFEIEDDHVLKLLDTKTNDVDIEKIGEPLLFSFATDELLTKYGCSTLDEKPDSTEDLIKGMEKMHVNVQGNTEIDKDSTEDIIQGMEKMHVNVQGDTKIDKDSTEDIIQGMEKMKIDKPVQDDNSIEDIIQGVDKMNIEDHPDDSDDDFTLPRKTASTNDLFIIDKDISQLAMLETETEQIAKEYRKEYKEDKTRVDRDNKWLTDFMQNGHYLIHSTASNGNCFFDALRLAYAQNGHITTVGKLRKLLSDEVHESMFQDHKTLQEEMHKNILDEEMIIKNKTLEIQTKKKELDQLSDAKLHKDKLAEVKKSMDELAVLKPRLEVSKTLYEDYSFLENINDLDSYRKYMLTSNFWIESSKIPLIEKALQLKCIIFQNEEEVTIQCSENLPNQEAFHPKNYVLLHYKNDHYELISYKKKKLLVHSELPYDLKVKIVKRCMENISFAGIYNQIPEFIQFQNDLGVVTSHKKSSPDEAQKEALEYGYDASIEFSYFSASNTAKAPGKGNSEKIPPTEESKYKQLQTEFGEWRKMLDDSWSKSYFQLDGLQWSSIKHYVFATINFKRDLSNTKLSKYAEQYNNMYLSFAYQAKDSNEPGNQEFAVAIRSTQSAAANKKGKEPGEAGKFYDLFRQLPKHTDAEEEELRKKALVAKFNVSDMKKMLSLTQKAKLCRFRTNKAPLVDFDLMKIRQGQNI